MTPRSALKLTAVMATLLGSAAAQPFSSTSTGADGALTIPAGDGSPQTIVFDPATMVPPRDADGDGIYHFTTITVPANITLKLRADKCGVLPLIWLAQGEVIIQGTLDLSSTATAALPVGTLGAASIPGPGGFPGGVAHLATTVGGPGFGPGGATNYTYGGSYGTLGYGSSPVYGNAYLLPLLGGSGGGGSYPSQPEAANGTAGGGAILIASTTQITLDGFIVSVGGTAGANAGRGSGGAVRLVAPSVVGTGVIDTLDADGQPYAGGAGRVRIESLNRSFGGTVEGAFRSVTLNPATPLGLTLGRARLRVTNIGGVAIPAMPTGTFAVPDAVINSASPVTVTLTASAVPLGTTATIHLINESDYEQTVVTTPLAGTLGSSSATATVTIPHGYTRGFAIATW